MCVSDGAVAVTSANNPKTHPAITKLQGQKINRCDTAAGLTDKEIEVGYRDTLGLKGVDWKFYSNTYVSFTLGGYLIRGSISINNPFLQFLCHSSPTCLE